MNRRTIKSRTLLVGSIMASMALPSYSLAATSPPAPKPPSVYTGKYAAPSISSATLKGGVNPHGIETSYYFQYGTTTAYGAQTSPIAAGSAMMQLQVNQPIAELQPYTTYHYRIVATNADGTAVGQDVAFTTKKAPLSLAITAVPNPVVFGGPLNISGSLSGTGNVGVQVVLQAKPFPYTHGFFDLTSPESSNSSGGFSFPIADLLQSTQLRVVTTVKPQISSPVISEMVTVRVTLHVRPTRRGRRMRLFGSVTPSATGALVAIERLDHVHRYVTVSGTSVRTNHGLSQFSDIVSRHPGVYRVLVLTSGAQVSGRSRPVRIR